jgi:eukaryotic-like serine/threonine-protein kinase
MRFRILPLREDSNLSRDRFLTGSAGAGYSMKGSEAAIEGTSTTSFGKYQLFASLGRGGMADVFLSVARGQMGVNKLAVVKRLRQALAEENAFRNMFLDEARLAARLSHPNIVHTYEVGEQDGVYFIAMEYLEGQSLNKVLKEASRRREMIDPAVSVRIVADALAGLGYAHELRDYDGRPLGVIHRDVSPHNIFVTYDGHTKLVDFGIAKAALSSTETEVGVLKGKVAYMSPEQALGHRIDARSDLFPMGIVLWELLTEQRLMTGENAANTLHKLMNEPIPRVSSVIPQIDPKLDAIVAKALEKDPNQRWSSAAEMRAALEAWIAATPDPARQEDVGRAIVHFFGPVREEVQRQIQKHMSALATAGNTNELQALTAESLKRMEMSGAAVTGQLLRLGTTGAGSGSGIVASEPPARANNTLLVVIAIGCFLLAAMLIVIFAPRRKDPDPMAVATVPMEPPLSPAVPSAVETTPPPPVETATPIIPAPSSSTPPVPKPHHPITTSKATPTSKPPAPEEMGQLTVSSYPWAKVTEGSKVVCQVTPCNKVAISAGTHLLTFENGLDPTQKQTVRVEVRPGELATKNVGFK